MNGALSGAKVDAHAFRSFVARVDEIIRRAPGMGRGGQTMAIVLSCCLIATVIGIPIRFSSKETSAFVIGIAVQLLGVIVGISYHM